MLYNITNKMGNLFKRPKSVKSGEIADSIRLIKKQLVDVTSRISKMVPILEGRLNRLEDAHWDDIDDMDEKKLTIDLNNHEIQFIKKQLVDVTSRISKMVPTDDSRLEERLTRLDAHLDSNNYEIQLIKKQLADVTSRMSKRVPVEMKDLLPGVSHDIDDYIQGLLDDPVTNSWLLPDIVERRLYTNVSNMILMMHNVIEEHSIQKESS